VIWVSVAAGVGVAAANGLAAWLALRWAWSRPRLVVPVVLGGMAVRLVAVGAASGLLVAFTNLDAVYYAGSLIFTFLVIQAVEIAAIVRRSAADREAASQS
jgi:hypothetical protein